MKLVSLDFVLTRDHMKLTTSRSPLVRSYLDDPMLNARKDVDLKDSQTDITWRTPRASETMCEKAVCL